MRHYSLLMAGLLLLSACGSDKPAGSPSSVGGSSHGGANANGGASASGGSASGGASGSSGSGGSGAGGSGASGGSGGSQPGQPGLVGMNGIAAWDALPASEKSSVTTRQSFFLHQSVGQDLEDGAEANGFAFEYAASGQTGLAPGLNGGLFSTSNGDPAGKINEWQSMALANASSLRLAIMKFGYADIVEGKAAGAQAAYQAAVATIKRAGVRVLHITPPFVYNVPAENATKYQTRAWMIETFKDDVLFDLEDVESTEPGSGARCERGGSWEICGSIRSTSGCPSKSQGIDAPSGQGHICFEPHAKRLSKAFLYAIYLAVK